MNIRETELKIWRLRQQIEAESFERKKCLGHPEPLQMNHSSQWLRHSKQKNGKERKSADVVEKTACDVYDCDGIFKAQDFRTCIYVESK